MKDYTTLKTRIEGHVAYISFNRPEKANALNRQGWQDLKEAFEEADSTPEIRVVVLTGEGKHFCSGIDVAMLMELNQQHNKGCEGRKRESLRQFIKELQAPVNAIEACRKPVIAAVHKGCIGAGVDIVSACDMRYATEDAYFTVKEIDMGMVADLGTLQRLPKIIPDGIAREMAFTGRKVGAKEAFGFGLVNNCYEDQSAMMDAVGQLGQDIAAKSPLSIRGTKEVMNYSREHTVAEGLNYVATWNAATILSDDIMKAMQAQMMKTTPEFED